LPTTLRAGGWASSALEVHDDRGAGLVQLDAVGSAHQLHLVGAGPGHDLEVDLGADEPARIRIQPRDQPRDSGLHAISLTLA
jgi:hypothetical protein